MDYVMFILKSAFADFARNKLRTFLTSLGILIGVASVVLLIAFGLGLKQYISDTFASLGSNLVFVLPGRVFQGGNISPQSGMASTKFEERDLTDIRRIREAAAATGAYSKSIKVASQKESDYSSLYAISAEYFTIRKYEIDYGRLFDKADVEKRTKVAVLGPKIAEKLYGDAESAVGKTIKLENQGFTVIGVVKSKGGGFGGPDFDTFVYLPYKAAYTFNTDKTFSALIVQSPDDESVGILKERIKQVLLKRFEEDDFSVVEQTEILNTVTSIFSMLNSVLVAIGAISLIVGGVGIMNIMFVTVTERTKEIGVRRAIGATKRDILFQFIAESVVLSLVGGLLGLLLSFGVVALVRKFFPAYIDTNAVLISMGVSSAVGIIFGVFPAKKAADLSPIEAIRYE